VIPDVADASDSAPAESKSIGSQSLRANGEQQDQTGVIAFKKNVLARATACAQKGDHVGAMKAIEVAIIRLGTKVLFIDEMRGTVQSLEKDYPAAEASFRVMLEKSPESYVARFNLSEMIFLQGRYQEAETNFAAIEDARRQSDPAVADLCHYKRIICRLAAGSIDEAEAILPSEETVPPNPVAFFGKAVILFAKKDIEGADKAIDDASKHFSLEAEKLYLDSLLELKWGARAPSGKFHFFREPLRN
jgi:tetratricopeptide (TPR) repeat protein